MKKMIIAAWFLPLVFPVLAQANCQLFEHSNYQGASLLKANANVPWVGNTWNDRVSSVRLTGGSRLKIWLHKDYGGDQRDINSSTSYIGDLWNDQLSSFNCITPALPYGVDTCVQGYVWREARSSDRVCVVPAQRTQAAEDNRLAQTRREMNGGAYGSETCKQGYVWREAFAGDTVCVTPETRSQVRSDNARAEQRKAANVVN